MLVLSDTIQLCVSGDVYAEYEDVIRRPRFRLAEETIATTLEAIRLKGSWVKVTQTIRVCADPDDDIFVECASSGQANYLVTGNLRDFPEIWRQTAIVTPRRFLESEFEASD
jgi:putative PIN family toxin of toxin-antitoxin system